MVWMAAWEPLIQPFFFQKLDPIFGLLLPKSSNKMNVNSFDFEQIMFFEVGYFCLFPRCFFAIIKKDVSSKNIFFLFEQRF